MLQYIFTMTQKDRILYVGYGFNGEPGLDSLLKQGSFDIVTVVAPPLGIGRYRVHGGTLPLEQLANQHNIPVVQTNDNAVIAGLIAEQHPDSVLMCVYNKLLPQEILASGPSFYNLHHGLHLPRLRGSSNTEWAVRLGLNRITLSLFQVVPGLDEGKLVWEPEITITDDENITDLRARMNARLRTDLGAVYRQILHPDPSSPLSREVVSLPQTENGATYCCSIRKADSEIDWRQPAKTIYDLVRSVNDPELDRAFTFYDGRLLDVWRAKVVPAKHHYEGHIPGKPISRTPNGVEVLTGDTASNILLQEVEYKGHRMPAQEAITSIRETLGINTLDFLRRIQDLETIIRSLETH